MKTMTTKACAGRILIGLGTAGALLLSQAALAATPAEKRAELRKMCDEALATLYKAKPEVKAAVEKSAGYGCFTSFGMSFFVGGAGGGGMNGFGWACIWYSFGGSTPISHFTK